VQRQQLSAAAEAFANANLQSAEDTRRSAFAKTFPKFLSEMGQQSGKLARGLASQRRSPCALRKNIFAKRRLVRSACILRCVGFDAAMHYRNSGTGPHAFRENLETIFRIGCAQQNNAAMHFSVKSDAAFRGLPDCKG
jgi:hypothetical protein